VAEIWIADVSPGMIVAQVLLADTTVRAEGRQVPLPFEIRFEPARAEATHTYALKAVIKSADGQELFTSGDSTFVITQGHPSRVDLVLNRGGGGGGGGSGGLAGSSWVLEDLAGAGVVDRVQATLDFTEPGRVVGNASCNRFFGSVEIAGATIRIGSLGATKMACAEAINNQEMKYMKALENAERFTLEGTTLQVFVKGADKPLRFTRRG